MDFNLDCIGLTLDGRHRAIEEISLGIAHGDRVAVIGPSGAGKTSLLRVLCTALRPTSGRITVEGRDPWSLSREALRRLRARTGTIYQAPPLPPRQRVVTAVLAGRVGRRPPWKTYASPASPPDIPRARAALRRGELAQRPFGPC